MENKEKCWKTKKGELYFSFTSNTWSFINDSRKVFITSWRDTEKGPMTEVVLEDGKNQVILEILEKEFNEELYLPEQPDETMKKVMDLCQTISIIDTGRTDYWMTSSLISCMKKLIQQSSGKIKCIHAYYGNGLFFGMKMNIFGKIKKLDSIPGRCMEFPGTRLDTV